MKKKIAIILVCMLCALSVIFSVRFRYPTESLENMDTHNCTEEIIKNEGAATGLKETLTQSEITSEPITEAATTELETIHQAPVTTPPQTQGQWTYAPIPSSAKTYEAYYMITDKTSKQWALLQILNYDTDGMIRDNEGYIAAALGSYFGPIGSRWIFLLDNGKQIKIIKADQKQDQHTYNYNCMQGYAALDIIEFVVDDRIMPRWSNGYIYGGNFNNCLEYQGKVIAWQRVD